MAIENIILREDVSISVERMMRFCHLTEMMFEHSSDSKKALPLHLTRFGVLAFETASFLYSLFEDRNDSINVLKIWQGFEHPFEQDLQGFIERLTPFMKELKFVRNRVGFHGSLNRGYEKTGLGIFDVNSPRALEFSRLVLDMQMLSLRMIAWYIEKMDRSQNPDDIWKEFIVEIQENRKIKSD